MTVTIFCRSEQPEAIKVGGRTGSNPCYLQEQDVLLMEVMGMTILTNGLGDRQNDVLIPF